MAVPLNTVFLPSATPSHTVPLLTTLPSTARLSTPSDVKVCTVNTMPVYPAGTFIRYFPAEGKDMHYTVIQMKTGEALQVKTPSPAPLKPLKFPNMQAWYETLHGAPDIATFKVTMGKDGMPFDLSKVSHLAPLPPIVGDRYKDIYCWNRQILKVLMEFAPDLLQNATFVENYNTLVETLKKYAPKGLTLFGSVIYAGGFTKLLLASKVAYGQNWFNCLPIRFDNYYRRDATLPPNEEIETVQKLIGLALNNCIIVIKPRLEPILNTKDKLCNASYSLGSCRSSLSRLKTKIARLIERQSHMEKIVERYEHEVEEAKKTMSDLTSM